ncbi:MAG: ABC transporter substrate-binding protein [Thermodesulfobacteriota bacterium]|nr:ABC transporter substrate-binding protein [Thermodesulfobacteriota bacterium]
MNARVLFSCSRFFFIGAFLVNLISLSSSIGYSNEVRGVTDDTITVGLICDQTGPIADITLPLSEGVRNYTRHVNDQGGIHRRKIKLLVEDDRYSIPVTMAAFKKLIYKDKILALMGPGSVGGTRTLLRQIEKLKLPTVPPIADKILVYPFRRYIFLPCDFYDDEIGVMFEYIMKDMKVQTPRLAFCYPDAESGKLTMRSAKKWAESYNLDIHLEIIPMAALEASSQVMSIKRYKPTHLMIHHTSQGVILMMREMRKFGLDIPVFGTFPNCVEETVRIGGKASKNYIGAHAFSSWYDESPGMADVREITLKYHPGTEKPYRSKQYTVGWTTATILYEGITRAGKNLNGESLVDAMETIQNLDTNGLCGPITYTSKSHKGLDYCKLFKADPPSGKLLPITEWRKPPSQR